MVTYTINDINTIKSDGFTNTLTSDVISVINKIASQVGSTDYIKTPHFEQKPKKKTKQEISDDDWENIKKYQVTVMKQHTGIDENLNALRLHFNNITKTNYLTVYDLICKEIDKIITLPITELTKIGELIFKIASSNSFYSDLYASIYKKLITKYSFMKTIFNEHFINYSTILISIEPTDTSNYDLLCEYNTNNNLRRSLGLFYINLMKENMISSDVIIDIIIKLQQLILTKMKSQGNKDIVDELSENIYILIINGKEILSDCDDWQDIRETIETISKYKMNDYPSITNKTIFKHMDICDEL